MPTTTTTAPPPRPTMPVPVPVQGSFDELGTPLRDVTFVVVDLETTGGSPAGSHITEIGAVKVRGGERLGTFQTLVNPGESIPAFITVLTGISDAMVLTAPPIGGVLPAFLEFAHGAVLVAHNAPFDVGFLRAGCEQLGLPWPGFDVVDTARLARRVLTRDESPDCKLATLSRLFRTTTSPCHRALADAEATVDVLHGLLDRVGNQGVQSMEELRTFSAQVSPAQRRKRHLAEALPSDPGVYVFRDRGGRPLYVGKSRNLRGRVRQYFMASETRSRMAEMVGLAERVDPIVCATELEAEVRELRLIAEHKPRYNRRSRWPERALFLKVTTEPFPRLSLVREVRDDGATYLGPFGSRRAAELAITAVYDALPLRQCTRRLSTRRPSASCALGEMGRCLAPCELRVSVEAYAGHVGLLRRACTGNPHRLVAPLVERLAQLAAAERFEDAAALRDRIVAFVRAAARLQRLSRLAGCAELVAAAPTEAGGWQVHVVRHGRLAAAGVVAPRQPARPVIDALRRTAEVVSPGPGPTPAATAEEMECILRWLDRPGTRIVDVDGLWACPAYGAEGMRDWLDAADEARAAADPFADRRGLRPVHRPARARVG